MMDASTAQIVVKVETAVDFFRHSLNFRGCRLFSANSQKQKMKSTLLTALIISTFSLVACGGVNPDGSSSPPVAGISIPAEKPSSVERIKGIVVPPDPGAAKDLTVAGVDTDGNGIRDEIDRWIATKYGDKPGALDAIRMTARSDQKTLSAKPVTKEDALAVIYESMDTGGCVGGELRRNGLVSSEIFNESMIRTLNTKDRILADKQIGKMAGMILRNVNDSTFECPYKR